MLINDHFKTDLTTSTLHSQTIYSRIGLGKVIIASPEHPMWQKERMERHESSRKGRQSDHFTHPRLSHYEEEGENPSTNCRLGSFSYSYGLLCNFYSTAKLSNCQLT